MRLSISSVILGLVIGVIMTAANVYLGLYAGMTVSASIPAAVLAMGFYKTLFRNPNLEDSNIVQTMASAGESLAAGVIFTLPAMVVIGVWSDFEFWTTTLIAICGGLLGIMFMIPLRKVLIEEQKDLTYPEGVACASVLKSASDQTDSKGFTTILKGLFVGSFFKLLAGLGLLLPSVEWAKKFGNSSVFVGSDVSSALVAVGYIVNLNVAILVFMGGLIGFSIAIPMLGTPENLSQLSALDLAWTLWSTKVRYLGVGAMIVGGVFSIIKVRSGITKGIKGLKSAYGNKEATVDLPLIPMLIVMSVCFLIMFFVYYNFIQHFGITLITSLLMLVISFLFVAVSSYIVGLVGSSNNPVSGMTISALLLSAALFLALGFTGDSAILATLGVAAIVCCAACTAGDCSQDLKTGSLIGARPASQQLAQILGVVIPAFVIAPVLTLLHEAYGIGDGLKAPQAMLFASLTKALFGQGELATSFVLYGVALGVIIILLDEFFLKNKSFRLHLMPLAVGIYLPVTLAYPIFLGGLMRYLVKRKVGELDDADDKGVLASSGMIAGEAIMGVVLAILIYNGIHLKITESTLLIKEIFSFVVLIFLGSFVYKLGVKSKS
jgi:putative OPT family oligopeptide transporter